MDGLILNKTKKKMMQTSKLKSVFDLNKSEMKDKTTVRIFYTDGFPGQ
jgi:hypothetical protein